MEPPRQRGGEGDARRTPAPWTPWIHPRRTTPVCAGNTDPSKEPPLDRSALIFRNYERPPESEVHERVTPSATWEALGPEESPDRWRNQ